MNKLFYRFSKSTRSMFWALFDQADLEDFNTKDTTFEITQETGKVLFAFYSICIIMVALNMLIATMTHSYDSISVRKTNYVYTAESSSKLISFLSVLLAVNVQLLIAKSRYYKERNVQSKKRQAIRR